MHSLYFGDISTTLIKKKQINVLFCTSKKVTEYLFSLCVFLQTNHNLQFTSFVTTFWHHLPINCLVVTSVNLNKKKKKIVDLKIKPRVRRCYLLSVAICSSHRGNSMMFYNLDIEWKLLGQLKSLILSCALFLQSMKSQLKCKKWKTKATCF